MTKRKLLSAVLAGVMALSLAFFAAPAADTEAAGSSISVTTKPGAGSLVAYFGNYVYFDYNYVTGDSTEVKSMVENSYISGDTVGHIGHYAWREGYGFAGWAEKENGTPIDMSTYKVTKDVTLYPVWSNDYSNVTFADGCRYINGTFAIANGSSLKPYALREAYNKTTGYPFKGFTTKKGSTKVIDLDTYKVTKDVTLYPVYGGIGKTIKDSKGNKYTVTAVGSENTVFEAEFKAPKNKKITSLLLESYFYDDNGTYFNVPGIGKGALKGCTKLKKFTASYMRYIDPEAFSGCTKLKSIGLPGFYGEKSDVKNCFKGSSIKSIHVYDGYKDSLKTVFTKKNTGSKTKIKIYEDFIGY